MDGITIATIVSYSLALLLQVYAHMITVFFDFYGMRTSDIGDHYNIQPSGLAGIIIRSIYPTLGLVGIVVKKGPVDGFGEEVGPDPLMGEWMYPQWYKSFFNKVSLLILAVITIVRIAFGEAAIVIVVATS